MPWKALSCLLLLLCASACRTVDEARVLQSLNQRGFGRKYASGDSNEILTLGIGDGFIINDPANPDLAAAATLGGGQPRIGPDGTVQLGLINKVYVAGFSTEEIAETLNQHFKEYYNNPQIEVYPLMPLASKRLYLRGEVTTKGSIPFEGNQTVWDVIMVGGVPVTADISDIEVIRADPNHPLVIPVDLEQMFDYGVSRDNIILREDDIVVVNPNLAGHIRNLVQYLLAPITPVLQLAISLRTIEDSFESFTEDDNFNNNRYGGYGGGGYGGGGSLAGPYSNGAMTVPQGGSAP